MSVIKRSAPDSIKLGETSVFRFVHDTLYLNGDLTIIGTGDFVNRLFPAVKLRQMSSLVLNLDGIEKIDSAGVTSLFYVQRKLEERGVAVELVGGSDPVKQKLDLFRPDETVALPVTEKTSFLENIGKQIDLFFSSYVFEFLILAANVFYWSFAGLFNRKSRREGEFVNQSILIGVNAVLIVSFLSFVIGYVMALQSSGQLASFGANIYVVDLVVIAVMSQMGPLITAVLVAGRSGSAIAAEIATMKVTAELDALTTMGLNPIRFVVVPKLYAALLTMPFLVILSNVAGLIGGGVAANVYLDITPEIFINRMGDVMTNKHLVSGFVKSQAYASLIVLTGSFYGFRVVRGAEGVGKVTTVAVVVAITMVILADSVLGLLFY
jgi:phospholipid/cholesterol/gamma-HCH transport system permease protein